MRKNKTEYTVVLLDYAYGTVSVFKTPPIEEDIEDYLNMNYNMSDCYYMANPVSISITL